MPSVDQIVTINPVEMATVTNSLETFDKYKPKEDKDSDEESFHLPLDDDETHTKGQESIKTGSNSENDEEDLLSKFDSTSTSEIIEGNIDAHLEDQLLNGDDEEMAEGVGKLVDETKKASSVEEVDVQSTKENEDITEEPMETTTDEPVESKAEEENVEPTTSSNMVHDASVDALIDRYREDSAEEDPLKEPVPEAESKKLEPEVEPEIQKTDTNITSNEETTVSDVEMRDESETSAEVEDTTIVEESKDSEAKVDSEYPLKEAESEPEKVSEDSEVAKTVEKEVVEDSEKNSEEADTLEKVAEESEETPAQTEPVKQTVTEVSEAEKEEKTAAEDPEETSGEPEAVEKTVAETPTNHNEDSEELFDISIIRDVAEDNAENALDELEEAERQLHNEESLDFEENTEKIDETEEDPTESDTARPETECEFSKNDEMDIEESSLKLDPDSAKALESAERVDDAEVINNKDDASSESKVNGDVSDDLKMVSDEEQQQPETRAVLVEGPRNTKTDATVTEVAEPEKDAVESRKSLKRLLSDEEQVSKEDGAKKFKADTVSPPPPAAPAAATVEKPSLRSLCSLAEFMKSRKSTRRLTMRDLEEFCVQKICEVLVHNSQIGDVNHQLKLQEQQVESMRKEIQQLTKQCKDLEIVNKKLLNDLRQLSPADTRQLNPLKITRSVGMQVKMVAPSELIPKRKAINSTSQKAAAQLPASVVGSRNIPQNTITPTSTRQMTQMSLPVKATPGRKPADTVDSSPSPQATRLKVVEPKASSAASVIDLTDEDDKSAAKTKQSPTKIVGPPKSITLPFKTPVRVQNAQGLRFTTTQTTGKNGTITTSPHQLMYVVHSSAQNVLNSPLGSKAVVVNFQSGNNILTSALAGSAVSVLPNKSSVLKTLTQNKTSTVGGNTGNIALTNHNKVIKLTPPFKHPAPLPAPPTISTKLLEAGLKPIPPKPYLTIRKTETGIILQWKMPYDLESYETIASYQLYAYQETSALPSTEMWRKVGDVKALALPMACTLTQFADKNKYYFAVRPVDIHKRIGVFSEPEEISL